MRHSEAHAAHVKDSNCNVRDWAVQTLPLMAELCVDMSYIVRLCAGYMQGTQCTVCLETMDDWRHNSSQLPYAQQRAGRHR